MRSRKRIIYIVSAITSSAILLVLWLNRPEWEYPANAFGRMLNKYWVDNKSFPQSKGIYGEEALYEVAESRTSILLYSNKGRLLWQTWEIYIPPDIWEPSTGSGDRDKILIWAWGKAPNASGRIAVLPMGFMWSTSLSQEQLTNSLKYTRETIMNESTPTKDITTESSRLLGLRPTSGLL